ncbi:gliding motility lipoprotein GldB [Pseudochryseolinea flava]|uniref:Gliding motility lipoprotein GldB n=1 Tax=Pseudochryseolinea flava TaxID=2059302 RepID=A0A364Y9V1_9BACT|nr:gliding motility lipoprotein GldB [Pseudochryseolinea flava]RAW03215.1 gliding motility lipoprotein GldB [Pseudochryseolinea flava]
MHFRSLASFAAFISIAALHIGCNSKDENECAPQPSVTPLTIEFEQFEDTIAAIQSKEQLVSFLTRQPLIRDFMLRRGEYPGDSVFINTLYKRFSSNAFDSLLIETKRIHGDLSTLKAQFNQAFSNFKHYYPDFNPPKVKTMISGLLDTDMIVSDSVIIVSLDFFLGKEGKYRPRVYDYQLAKYDPEDIVASLMLVYGIDTRFNATDVKDKTVLAEMISYGKAFAFAKHMLPCVPDSTFIWYTPQEMAGSKNNQDLIWARFVQDEILFSTSNEDKRNYLGERPITTQVGEKCPGRIGLFIGWQIVKAYMDSHPEMTLQQLMQVGDAQKLFKDSHYKPKQKK